MNILIDNTNSINKGAELMLYAVLQELERKFPDANVWFPLIGLPEGSSYIQTTMNFKKRDESSSIFKLFVKCKGLGILHRLNIHYVYFSNRYAMKNLDLVLDAGGFQFTDQVNPSKNYIRLWDKYLHKLKQQGTRVIFLPQAFGPLETTAGKQLANSLNKYANCLIAREEISFNHLINAGVNEKKILLYPDFTALVEGVFPLQFEHLKGGIAIIPNMRMIDRGAIDRDNYLETLIAVINVCRKANKQPFLLNHENKDDLYLCKLINKKLKEKLPIVNDMTALEIKGIISQCYMTFSSRFHGVVSSLNTSVPCLATSWSHKYEMLFRDFGIEGCVVDPYNKDLVIQKVQQFLDENYNQMMRQQLNEFIPQIKNKNKEMWNNVWNILSQN